MGFESFENLTTAEAEKDIHKDFEYFWNSGRGVFELIGKIKGDIESNSLYDFKEEERPEILSYALNLGLTRLSTFFPDLEAIRIGLKELKDSSDSWLASIDKRDKVAFKLKENEVRNRFDSFDHGLRIALIHSNLPKSAGEFEAWNEKLDRTRKIPSFITLLKDRVRSELELLMVSKDYDYWDFLTPETFSNFFGLYNNVEALDVPIYRKAVKRIVALPPDQQKVFYGRDAEYLFKAFKAFRFGLVGPKVEKLIYINSGMRYSLEYGEDEARDRIMGYLLQEQISSDAIHIDTGYRGSVPEAVIRALNPGLSEDEIDSRIKLLNTGTGSRRLKLRNDAITNIESRPHKYSQVYIDKDPNSGKFLVKSEKEPFAIKRLERDLLSAVEPWVVEQAVLRSLLPRKGVKSKWNYFELLKEKARSLIFKRILS